MTEAFAGQYHKLNAVTETGYNLLLKADWWAQTLLPIISKYKLSYLMVWRNAGVKQYFGAYRSGKRQ